MRLSRATADLLPTAVARPGYDRAAQRRGIVHLGIGAFHRAHQAVYTDAAMAAGDRDWAITGVSLRAAQVRDALAPQDGLYTVTAQGAQGGATRLIGAVTQVLVAPEDPAAVSDAIAAADTRIVTLTVTEKGYLRRPDGTLDMAAAARAGSPYALLAAAMRARRAAGLPGLTLLSCDNLAENGRVLGAAMAEYLAQAAPDLSEWFAAECACPATMVDRIVPAATADGLAAVAGVLGMTDAAAIATEPFHQWVIEDRFATARPRWEAGGARFVADVRPYETAKLRLLNGAHSALAYLGIAAGAVHVHEAIADARVGPLVERLMREEALPSIATAPGQDLPGYADALLRRFANSALPHRLRQIAADGSQKIGPRWLEPLAINRAAGRESPATLRALGAWLRFVRGDDGTVDDPLAAPLARLWHDAGRDGIVDAVFGERGLLIPYGPLAPAERAALRGIVAEG